MSAVSTASLEMATSARADQPEPTPLLIRMLQEIGVPASELGNCDLEGALDAWRHLTRGYHQRPEDVVGDASFDDAGDEAVVVRDIPYVSLCREHLVPFRGRALVAYLPGGAVVGLSKIAGIVDIFAHRLQTPSRLAQELACGVETALGARGVAVRIQADPGCPGASGSVESRAYRGAFRLPLWRKRLDE